MTLETVTDLAAALALAIRKCAEMDAARELWGAALLQKLTRIVIPTP